jgi:hypothetical protein
MAFDGKMEHCKGRTSGSDLHHCKHEDSDRSFHKKGDHMMMIMKELDLTEYQQEEMKQIKEENRKENIQRRADIDILEIDLKGAMSDHDFETARKITREIAELKTERAVADIDQKEEIWNLLDSDQREKFKEMIWEKPRHKEMKDCGKK